MASVTVQNITDKDTWENFLSGHDEANFLQSWYWGELHDHLGKTNYRVGFFIDEKLVGVMLVIVEAAKRARYLIVPAGPIIDWGNKALVATAVEEMKRIGKQERCAFVRVRPQISHDLANQKLFKDLGFRPAQMHLHEQLTIKLDITKEETELLQSFRKNTRYELRRAKKTGIKVSVTTDPEAIEGFYKLQVETAKRNGFVPFGKQYFKEQFAIFADAGKALLYSAHTSDGKLIAQAFVIFYNQEADYHYGASTDLARSEPGAYAIQWEAIKEAKRRGMRRYDFWGVVKPEQTKHRFYGVSVFKRGFRGEDVEYLHAQDLVLSKTRYLPNLLIESVRKRRRRL